MITSRDSSIVTDISNIRKDIDQLKSEQMFGYDTTQLKMITNDNSYDVSLSIPSSGRAHFEGFCVDTLSVYPAHIQSYSQILYQVYVGDLSTPYYGESSGIGIFSPTNSFSPFAPGNDMLILQMINTSVSSITVYVKVYAITTLTEASVLLNGYLL